MAAQFSSRLDPFVMVLDRLRPLGESASPKTTFPVDHDEQALHAVVGSSLLQFTEIPGVLRFVLEELIDIFDPVDAELFLRDLGEVERIQFLREERLVQRPLGERDPVQRCLLGSNGGAADEGGGSEGSGRGEKLSASGVQHVTRVL